MEDHDDRLRRQTDWYQQRFNALRAWVNREVRPLSEEAANRYFAIVANGSPAPHEQADWRDTMHGLTLRAESAERERDSALKHAQELRAALEGYHKGADSIPYAQWSREQHAADIALKRTMP